MAHQQTDETDFQAREEAWHLVTAPDYSELMEKGQFARILLRGMVVQFVVGNAVFLPILSQGMPVAAAPIDLSIKTNVPHLTETLDHQVSDPFISKGPASPLCLKDVVQHQGDDPCFDMLICVDALYHVPSEVEECVSALVAGVKPGGGVLFYQTSRISACHHIYEAFADKCGEDRPRRVCVEDIFTALDPRLQTAAEVPSTHRIAVDDTDLLERYLQRLCNATDWSLADFMAINGVRAVFNAHRVDDHYELPHMSWVVGDEITIKTLAGIIEPPIVLI